MPGALDWRSATGMLSGTFGAKLGMRAGCLSFKRKVNDSILFWHYNCMAENIKVTTGISFLNEGRDVKRNQPSRDRVAVCQVQGT